jgi:hypothetical protein
MNNELFDAVTASRHNYCHVLEVDNVSTLTSLLDDAFETYTNEGFDDQDVFDFLRTLDVSYWVDGIENAADEDEVNNFDVVGYLLECHF